MPQDTPPVKIPEQLQHSAETEPDPVIEAFRTELRSILDQPLSAKSLNQVLQVAQAAQQLLAVRSPRNKLRGGLSRMGSTGIMNSNYGAGYIGYPSPPGYSQDFDEDEDGEETSMSQASVGRNNVDRETFAARVLREIVGLVPQVLRASREDQAQIVQAIAQAQKLGMDDLALELRQRLLPDQPKTPTPIALLGSCYAVRAPGSDEYIAGPGPVEFMQSLKSPEHEIINTETMEVIVPAEPGAVA